MSFTTRVPLSTLTIKKTDGGAFPAGTSVAVYQRGTATPITLYQAASGGTTVPNPTTVDANGNAVGWALPQDVTITVTSVAGSVTVDDAIVPSSTDLPSVVDAALTGSPTVNGSPFSGSVPDATSSTKGVLKLTGDLGGTADSPTVPGLATRLVANNNLADVQSAAAALAALGGAPLASPALTGNPTAPTPTAGDNDTSIATTAFVTTAVGALARTIDVKSYGAKGDGSTDDTTAIGNAIAALTAGSVLYFPAGTYNHTGLTITSATDVTVAGDSATLNCTTQTSSVLTLTTCTRATVQGLRFKHSSTSGGRTGGGYAITVNGGSAIEVRDCHVLAVTSAGVWYKGVTGGRIIGNRVESNLADGIHLENNATYGPTVDVAVIGNVLRNTGDDAIAVVSTTTAGANCSRIVISGNTVYNSPTRGIAVVGGDNINIDGNSIYVTFHAGIYIAQETGYATNGCTNTRVGNNLIVAALTYTGSNSNHGAIYVWCDDTGKAITGVQIVGNEIVQPRRDFIKLDANNHTSVSDISVVGNKLVGPPVTTTFQSIILGWGDHYLCEANHISYAGTNAIVNYGTNAAIIGNFIYKPNQHNDASAYAILQDPTYGDARIRNNVVIPDGTKTALAGAVSMTAPTLAAGAGAGTSPPAPTVVSGQASTDENGRIQWGTGTSVAAGAQVTVTFKYPYGTAPRVMLNPFNTATANLNPYVSAVSTTGFTISVGTAPTASQGGTTYVVEYAVQSAA